MKLLFTLFPLLVAALWSVVASCAAEAPARNEWTIDVVKREALLRVPTAKGDALAPIVFVFHGHGGTMRQAARSQPRRDEFAAE